MLAILPRGESLDSAFLIEKGLSPSHALHFAKAGWLNHLGRCVYMLPGDTLSRHSCTCQTTHRFDADLPEDFGLQPLPVGHPEVLVSLPERALLELFSDVGKTESLQEVRALVESAGSLHIATLDTLGDGFQRRGKTGFKVMKQECIDTVRLLIDIAPDVFESTRFAIRGGTALNLCVQDMRRLYLGIDVVFIDHTLGRDYALQAPG